MSRIRTIDFIRLALTTSSLKGRVTSATSNMEDAQKILEKLLHKIANAQNCTDPVIELHPISTDGANFSSFLYAGKISSGNKDDINIFGKVVAVGEKFRSNSFFMNIFETESFMYTDLLKTFEFLEEKHNIDPTRRLQVAKFYGHNPELYEETIVLEDLTVNGYKTHDRLEPVDLKYAAAAFTELAKFHALSFALKEENPEKYQEIAEKLKPKDMNEKEMKEVFENMVKNAITNTKDEKKDRLMEFLSRLDNPVETMKYFALGDAPVLKHGDYRPSNLMHKIREDGSISVIPVDYQLVQPGCATLDLIYFIFTSTDEEFRKDHLEILLDHYYTQLSEAMTRLGVRQMYTRDTFYDNYKKNLHFGVLTAISSLPIVLVESTHAPKLGTDLEMSDLLSGKPGDLYKERLDGILNDFIKWGIL